MPVKKVCVITGGTSGIGLCTAQAMLEKGYTVYELSRRAEGAPGMKHIMADVTKEETLAAAVQEILKQEDHIDVLINNAGFGAFGPASDMDEAMLKKMIRLNVMALTSLSLRMARRMKREGRGRIMNVASTAAFQPCPYLGVYGATKSYVLSFTESLAEELKGSGVTVTAFCPGPTRTQFGVTAGLSQESPFDRLSADPERVAETGFKGMMAGRVVVLDGATNRFGAFMTRFLPRCLVRRIAGGMLAKLK